MSKSKSLVLKKDIIIKAGTVFNCVDNSTRKFVRGNYSTILGLTPNTTGEFVYGFESELLEEWFDESIKTLKED